MDSVINVILKSFLCFYIVESNVFRCCNGLDGRFSSNSSASYVVKLRGLPWSVTKEDIINFFDGCNIKNGTLGVQLIVTKEGRASGVAFVEMETEDDLQLAYEKDRNYLGDRFVEVFAASKSEMERTVRRSEQSIHRAITDACVRLRGLPHRANEQDVLNFFEGLDVVPNGVFLIYDEHGRATGEAYVQFRDQKVAERALQRDKGNLYHRYVEVFRSSLGELRLAQLKQQYPIQPGAKHPQMMYNRQPFMSNHRGSQGYQILKPLRFSGYPAKNPGGEWNSNINPQYYHDNARHPEAEKRANQENNPPRAQKQNALRMRGLPFNATPEDIVKFFSPVVPLDVEIFYNSMGKATGQAEVVFKSQEDLAEAMIKHNSYMGHRYIELFE